MSQAQASSSLVSVPEVLEFPVPFTDDELRLLAEHFAGEFGYDEHAAYVRSAGWYHQQVEVGRCTFQRAVVLRHMAIHECQAYAAGLTHMPKGWTVYEGKEAPANRERRAKLYGSLPRLQAETLEQRVAGMSARQKRAAFHLLAFSGATLLVLLALLVKVCAR